MQKIVICLLLFVLVSCGAGKTEAEKRESIKEKYASEIKTEDLKEHLYLLSSDILEGRKTGEKRQKMAVNYLTAFYDHNGLLAVDHAQRPGLGRLRVCIHRRSWLRWRGDHDLRNVPRHP